MKNSFLTLAMLFLTFLLFFSGISCAGEPTDRVHTMLEKVMAIQTDPSLQGENDREQRRAAIQKVILENFNFDAMAKDALGEQWRNLDNSQQAEFKTIFQDLFGDSYTRLVLNFLKREKILYNNEILAEGIVRVDTTIYRTNEEIPVEYLLAPVNKGWLVNDVKIDGVSIIENYRKSFSRVIKLSSYEDLLEKMRLQRRAIKSES